MKNRFKTAFDEITADPVLLRKTSAFLYMQASAKPRRHLPQHKALAGLAAAALFFGAGIFLYRFYTVPMAYVGIDVNPSIEFSINRLDKVVGSYAFNAEGKAILSRTDIEGKAYRQALEDIIAEIGAEGYLIQDGLVTITVQADDLSRQAPLQSSVETIISGQLSHYPQAPSAEVLPISGEVRKRAHGCNVSAAKYLALQELMEVDESATFESYSSYSIGEIRTQTDSCRQHRAHGAQDTASSAESVEDTAGFVDTVEDTASSVESTDSIINSSEACGTGEKKRHGHHN